MIRKTPLSVFLFVAALGLTVVAGVLMTPNRAYAGGAVGGGSGSTGGCSLSSCPHTNNGYGWYNYSVNDDGPDAFRYGGSWAQTRQTCIDTGNDAVIAFIIQTPTGSPANAWVYPYVAGGYGTYWKYLGNNGGKWLTYSYAQSLYYSLPASIRSGWTWGSNVAWFCYNFSKDWSINGQSYIQKGAATGSGLSQGTITAAPGDRLNWYHDMRNVGPDAMDKYVSYQVDKAGFTTNNWNSIVAPNGSATGGINQLFVTIYATAGGAYTIYDVQQGDVGNTLCQRISWAPGSSGDNNRYASNYACAAVPYNYNLIPNIDNITDGAPVFSSGSPIPVNGRVTNNGPTKSQPSVNWQLTEVKFAPGATITNKPGGDSSSNPCAYFSGSVGCTALQSGNEASGYAYPSTKTYNGNSSVDGVPVGTRVCYAMSVTKYAAGTSNWRHSQLYCLIVNKKPTVHVSGGDLIVGRGSATNASGTANVTTSVPAFQSGSFYGSWAEYAILASGKVTGMSSAAGLSQGATTKDMCSLSLLTFANSVSNICVNTNIGNYAHGSTIAPDVGSRFPTDTDPPTPDVPLSSGTANLSSLQGLYKTNQTSFNIRASGDIGEVSPGVGRWVVINAPNATVTITSNIRYTSNPITSVLDIPQVVIIAKNIIIPGSVTNIDSWLIAVGQDGGAGAQNGVINTCSDVTAVTDLRNNICDDQLVVNGPVMANHLLLRRTYGAKTTDPAGVAAEVFNLRADAYIWGTNYVPGTGRLPTVSSKELPPRF